RTGRHRDICFQNGIKMKSAVDILTVNCCTLPWLKLLVRQIDRLKPTIPAELFVWDSASSDGSDQWLLRSAVRHYINKERSSHAQGLIGLIEKSDSPYVAYIDIDAMPIKAGWLDDAVEILKD